MKTGQRWPVFFRPHYFFQTGKTLKVGALRPTGKTGHANRVIFACDPPKTAPRLRLHWTYR
jgi:hypothetical protein